LVDAHPMQFIAVIDWLVDVHPMQFIAVIGWFLRT